MITHLHYLAAGRNASKGVKYAIDTTIMVVSFAVSALIVPRSLWAGQSVLAIIPYVPILIAFRFICYYALRHHVAIWRYSSLVDLTKLIESALISSVLFLFAALFVFPVTIPPLVILLDFMLFLFLAGGARLTIRRIFEVYLETPAEDRDVRNVLIYGGGRAGELLLRNIKSTKYSGVNVVGLVDDDPFKRGRRIHNVPVIGSGTDISRLVSEFDVNEIYFAIASLSGAQTRRLLKLIEDQASDRVRVKIMPGLNDLVGGRVTVSQLRSIEIKDLLRRMPVELDNTPVLRMIRGRRILIAGAGGSIGSELCRQVAQLKPAELIVLDQSEYSLYQITEQLHETYPGVNIHPVVLDACREDQVRAVFREHHPEHVFHTAAYKHVPLMEMNPVSAVYNNVMSTIVLSRVSKRFRVDRFVLISTDKAVQPTNVMGATKRMCELVALNESNGGTKFMAVRFGNVLDSSGSVIPKFKKQISRGGPITVTHPEITRYFMLIPEAVELVLQAGAIGESGSIYVLNMGDPIRIRDLAEYMIKLSGLTPDEDIRIEYSGLRPGEKMHETLYFEGEECNTSIPDLMILRTTSMPDNGFTSRAEQFAAECLHMTREEIRAGLLEFVPEYNPQGARAEVAAPAHAASETNGGP